MNLLFIFSCCFLSRAILINSCHSGPEPEYGGGFMALVVNGRAMNNGSASAISFLSSGVDLSSSSSRKFTKGDITTDV